MKERKRGCANDVYVQHSRATAEDSGNVSLVSRGQGPHPPRAPTIRDELARETIDAADQKYGDQDNWDGFRRACFRSARLIVTKLAIDDPERVPRTSMPLWSKRAAVGCGPILAVLVSVSLAVIKVVV